MKQFNIYNIPVFFCMLFMINQSVGQSKEVILLQTDKPFYIAGDSVYFSTTLLNKTTSSVNAKSDIYYVQIYNKQLDVIKRYTGKMMEGSGAGALKLPEDLKTDDYLIIAYTKWMIQFDDREFFKKTVKVYGKNEKVLAQTSSNIDKYSLHVFPEGGSLVNGFPNKVGYFLNTGNNFATNLDIEAYLIANQNDTIMSFKPQWGNLGYFDFIPDSTIAYEVKFSVLGINQSKSLKEFRSNAITLKLFDSRESFLTIYGISNYPLDEKSFTLVVSNQGDKLLKGVQKFNGTKVTFSIPKEGLKPGVNKITLYDSNNQAVSSRFYYVERKSSEMKVELLDSVFQTNTRVKIPVKTSMTDLANFKVNVSILKDDFYQQPQQMFGSLTELTNNLLYTNGLQYYPFDYSNLKMIDIIMLSINEKNLATITGTSEVVINRPERSDYLQSINGQVFFAQDEDIPDPKQMICTVSNSKESFIYSTTTDNQGNFNFLIIPPKNDARLIISPYSIEERDSVTRLIINEPSPRILLSDFEHTHLRHTNQINDFLKYKLENDLIKRNYKSSNEQTQQIVYQNKTFFEVYDWQIDMTEYIELDSFYEICTELIPGIKLVGENGNRKIFLKNKDVKEGFYVQPMEIEPLILVDGVVISDSEEIYDIEVASIKTIRLINEEVSVNNLIVHGVLEITTINKNFYLEERANTVAYTDYLQVPTYQYDESNFYKPSLGEAKRPFFTELLYWKPAFSISNGTLFLEFNAGDDVGKYNVNLVGTDDYGNLHYFYNQIEMVQNEP